MNLNLNQNDIQNEGAAGLGFGISKLVNLLDLHLNLGSNEIQKKGACELGLGISKLLNL